MSNASQTQKPRKIFLVIDGDRVLYRTKKFGKAIAFQMGRASESAEVVRVETVGFGKVLPEVLPEVQSV